MSMNTEIYQDISTRTAGDIYIGVVGPVRAGKSTFIEAIVHQALYGNAGHPEHRQCLPPRAGEG